MISDRATAQNWLQSIISNSGITLGSAKSSDEIQLVDIKNNSDSQANKQKSQNTILSKLKDQGEKQCDGQKDRMIKTFCNSNQTDTSMTIDNQENSPKTKHSSYLMVWGSGEMDQFPVEAGDDNIETDAEYRYPTKLNINDDFVSIACGALHTVAITESGKIYTWGCNDSGALGRKPKEAEEAIPAMVPINKFVKNVVCGDSYTALLTIDGLVYVAGVYRDTEGILGHPIHGLVEDMFFEFTHLPVGENKIKKLANGENHTAALDDMNNIFLWGSNEFGQLLLPVPTQNQLPIAKSEKQKLLTPRKIILDDSIRDIFCGGQTTFICFENGKIMGAGRNAFGEVGCGSSDTWQVDRLVHVTNRTSAQIKFIGGGQFYTAALGEDGTVWTWGKGVFTGHGIEDVWKSVSSPRKIIGLNRIKKIVCGADHCFALDHNGILWAWGSGQSYQIGNGDDKTYVIEPISCDHKLFNGIIFDVAAGSQHSVALVTPRIPQQGEKQKLTSQDYESLIIRCTRHKDLKALSGTEKITSDDKTKDKVSRQVRTPRERINIDSHDGDSISSDEPLDRKLKHFREGKPAGQKPQTDTIVSNTTLGSKKRIRQEKVGNISQKEKVKNAEQSINKKRIKTKEESKEIKSEDTNKQSGSRGNRKCSDNRESIESHPHETTKQTVRRSKHICGDEPSRTCENSEKSEGGNDPNVNQHSGAARRRSISRPKNTSKTAKPTSKPQESEAKESMSPTRKLQSQPTKSTIQNQERTNSDEKKPKIGAQKRYPSKALSSSSEKEGRNSKPGQEGRIRKRVKRTRRNSDFECIYNTTTGEKKPRAPPKNRSAGT